MDDGRTADALEPLLDFYFGATARPDCTPEQLRACATFWFIHRAETDAEIRRRFEPDVARAARGELDAWSASPRGRLGLIVLLDQFPRNLNRGSALAFANDAKALTLALAGVENGDDATLCAGERIVFYLPLMHSEQLAIQSRSVDLYARLANEPGPLQPELRAVLAVAERHREIVARFGRFPHRNVAIGRESTAEEIAFRGEPNSSF